jgi:hypothetical protein
MRREHGATNFHVAIDSGIKFILIFIGLIGLSAAKQSTEDNK